MTCKNCKTNLTDTDLYCKNCGGKIIKNRLTISNLFENFSEQFLNYDNKFLQTFICLFTKPEDVIGSYIDGTRKKYVNPISFFAITITLAGLQMFFISKFFPEGLDLTDFVAEGQAQMSNKWMKNMFEYQSIVLMSFIPLYALVSKIVFFNKKKYNYTEHLVMFLYILSQNSLAMILPTLIALALGFTMGNITLYTIMFQIGFSAYCLKRVFDLSLKGIVLKTLLFFIVGFALYIILVILLILIMIIYYGGFAEFAKAVKPT
ncbi:DUF3667 domain-containing protein [Formosa maritima]|uniref:DUF3667 domain-containing protein n=1 Tax=Formosa maritima TaxID=2592046 RepID=A0A5D0GK94_9FLAO|nr:DUF3667 domain-containing protein [Formosa maritima]TYA58197.1 DUF3667 domain-containing protein [Formosa maritima]